MAKASAASLFSLASKRTVFSPPTTEMLPPGPSGKGARPNSKSGYWALKIAGIHGPSTIIATEPSASSWLVARPPPSTASDIMPLSSHPLIISTAPTVASPLRTPLACV